MAKSEQHLGLAAFAAALPTLRGELHRYLSRMMGSVIDAEDLLQDTLLAATRALKNGTEVRNMRSWLFRIAHNTAMNKFRARKREETMKEQFIYMPDEVSYGSEASLPEALTPYLALTPKQRSTVILRDVLGYSASEVAGLTDMSISAVKSALNRGRQALRSCPADAAPPKETLSASQATALVKYATLFNAHDFDGLREMLSDEVKLELVSVESREGKQRVSGYYTNYSKRTDWVMVPGLVEGTPAILSFDRIDPTGPPKYFILLRTDGDRVCGIRDFRYAQYAMSDARWSVIPSF
jgi:RNA polymerase sigma-70 factor, ECF subfamily